MARHRKHRNVQDPHTAADLWLESQEKVSLMLHHTNFLNLAAAHKDGASQVAAVILSGYTRTATLGWIQRQDRWTPAEISAGIQEADRRQAERAADLRDRGLGYQYIG
jgi:hypothetical protein